MLAARVHGAGTPLGSVLEQQASVATSGAKIVHKHPSRFAVPATERSYVKSNVDIALREVLGEGLIDHGARLDAARGGE